MVYYAEGPLVIRDLQPGDGEKLAAGEMAQGWQDTREKYNARLRDQAAGKAVAMAAVARHTIMTNIILKPSLRNKGTSYIVATWRRSTPPSLGRLPRLGPWRLCAWPRWLRALVWRISNILSTNSPVD